MFKFEFTEARREGILLRILLCGESGHGKTYSALALAHHMGVPSEQIGVIDSESQQFRDGRIIGSVEKYRGERCDCGHCQGHGVTFGELPDSKVEGRSFQQIKLPPQHRSPDDYRQAIRAAEAHGFRVLIVDSISHEWESCKKLVDQLKDGKFRGNKWAAWSEVVPMHDEFVQALLDFPGHVIACVRGKEKTEQQDRKIVSRGLLPIQRDQIEFEFDVWFNIHRQTAHVEKTRAKRLNGRHYARPGKELAEELLAWAGSPAGLGERQHGEHEAEALKNRHQGAEFSRPATDQAQQRQETTQQQRQQAPSPSQENATAYAKNLTGDRLATFKAQAGPAWNDSRALSDLVDGWCMDDEAREAQASMGASAPSSELSDMVDELSEAMAGQPAQQSTAGGFAPPSRG